MSFDKPTYVSHSTCADLQADVSGLYGQGAVACWLLALGSVAISWTFNRDCRVRDEITNDFVAAIAMPCVSAGHLIYQMIRRPSLFAIEDDESLVFEISKNWAGIGASHDVCAIFALWSLPLMIIADSPLHYRQQLVIGSVALLCLTAETITIWTFYSGTKLLLVLQYTTALMTVCPILWTASQLYTDIRAAKLKAISAGPAGPAEPAEPAAIQQTDTIDLELMARPTALPSAPSDAHLNDSHSQSHAAANNPDDQPEEPTMQPSSLGSASEVNHLTPLIWSGIGANIVIAINGTAIIDDLRACSKQWLLPMPMSNAKLGDLDQAVALAMGLCTLLYSVREAWKSQRARV